MYNICCIGHITLDKVVNSNGTVHMAGGTSYYFSKALRQMNVSFGLVTSLAQSEMPIVDELRNEGITVKHLPAVIPYILKTFIVITRITVLSGFYKKPMLLL